MWYSCISYFLIIFIWSHRWWLQQEYGGHDPRTLHSPFWRQARARLHGGPWAHSPLHQRQHKLPCRSVVCFRGPGAGGHDHWPGVLPQTVLWGPKGGVDLDIFSFPCCIKGSVLFFPSVFVGRNQSASKLYFFLWCYLCLCHWNWNDYITLPFYFLSVTGVCLLVNSLLSSFSSFPKLALQNQGQTIACFCNLSKKTVAWYLVMFVKQQFTNNFWNSSYEIGMFRIDLKQKQKRVRET